MDSRVHSHHSAGPSGRHPIPSCPGTSSWRRGRAGCTFKPPCERGCASSCGQRPASAPNGLLQVFAHCRAAAAAAAAPPSAPSRNPGSRCRFSARCPLCNGRTRVLLPAAAAAAAAGAADAARPSVRGPHDADGCSGGGIASGGRDFELRAVVLPPPPPPPTTATTAPTAFASSPALTAAEAAVAEPASVHEGAPSSPLPQLQGTSCGVISLGDGCLLRLAVEPPHPLPPTTLGTAWQECGAATAAPAPAAAAIGLEHAATSTVAAAALVAPTGPGPGAAAPITHAPLPAGVFPSASDSPPGPVEPRWDLEAAKQLTRGLRGAVTWRQLRELLAAHGPSLDAVHLVTAARRLRAVAPKPGRRVAREQALFRTFVGGFLQLCRYHLADMQPVPLSGVLYCMAALRCPPPADWMAVWLAAAEARLGRFGPREIANCVHALGQLEYDPGEVWLARVCAAAAAHLPPPEAASNDGGAAAAPVAARDGEKLGVALGATTGGAADLQQEEEDFSREAGGGDTGVGEPGFTAHGLSQLLWGLARLNYSPPGLCMAALCGEIRRQLPYFTAAGLSNALWGVTTLSYRPSDPWVASVAAASLRLMPTCTAYDMSISIWALLRLGYIPGGEWLAGFLSASYSQLPSASPEHSARMLWGLAKVGLIPPTDWLRRWLSISYIRLLEAEPRSLTTMMWALATLGIRPGRPWVDTLMVAAWEAPLRAFSPPDLAMLLWGLAQCGALPEEAWMDEFWTVSYKRLPVLPARHLALLLRSSVALGQAPSEQWLAGHEAVTLARMDEQTAEGLALLAYSYGMLERTPSREWFLALYGACAREGFADFDAMELERLIWGVARMGPPADAAPQRVAGWLDAFLARFVVKLYDASYCNFANVLFALGLLGVRPGEAWLAAAAARGEELLEEFGQTTAAKVLWALPRLAQPPPRAATVPATGGGGEYDQQATARFERLLEARIARMLRRPRAMSRRAPPPLLAPGWGHDSPRRPPERPHTHK